MWFVLFLWHFEVLFLLNFGLVRLNIWILKQFGTGLTRPLTLLFGEMRVLRPGTCCLLVLKVPGVHYCLDYILLIASIKEANFEIFSFAILFPCGRNFLSFEVLKV